MIAIIAILAAILFPVFAKVREKARQTACLSNQKQLGLAVMQYVQDYDESYPACAFQGYAGWAGQLYTYVKSTGVYHCPDDPTAPNGNMVPVSYGFNWSFSLQGNMNNGVSQGPVMLGGLNAPSMTVLLCEIQGDIANVTDRASDTTSATANANDQNPVVPCGWFGTCGAGTPSIGYATGRLPGRNTWNLTPASGPVHSGGANYIAADGHCKWLPPSRVSSGRAWWGNEQGDALDQNNPQAPNSDDWAGPRPTGTSCMDIVSTDTTCAHPGTATMTFSKL